MPVSHYPILPQFSSVQSLSCVRLFATPWVAACQASLSITNSQSLPNPCPLNWWCHPAVSSSVIPFSSCPQSFPASGSFPMSHFFASGGQIIGASASTSVLPMDTQDWSPLGWTGWISMQRFAFPVNPILWSEVDVGRIFWDLLLWVICRVPHAKCWDGWSTSWN